jgi:hypothetical protein
MDNEFTAAQIAAVRNVFSLVGYVGELRVFSPLGTDEYIFVLPRGFGLVDPHPPSQVIGQVLGRKVWIVEDGENVPATVGFAG